MASESHAFTWTCWIPTAKVIIKIKFTKRFGSFNTLLTYIKEKPHTKLMMWSLYSTELSTYMGGITILPLLLHQDKLEWGH